MPRRFALLCLTGLLAAGPAMAQTRVIAQANGWTAFGGTTQGGVATCGLETRDPRTGRHFLMQHLVGQEQPILRLSRPSWNLGASRARPVRLVIDNRRIFPASVTSAGREMSWPLPLDQFAPAFRLGTIMRVEFPSGQDSPWTLSLTGTNNVMGAFLGCIRMMVIQPGEAPPPIQPPPPDAPPPQPEPPMPLQPPLPGEPRQDLPGAKPVPVPVPESAPPARTPNWPVPGIKEGSKPGASTLL